ncbi:hypothetical protein FPZ24_15635 [Sphingomonas panacisoli]|uniref:Uncharacterized protein n=1 Tax=Sphingomonas panacisoli TaxID=1813879 RepID=A0A5B8LNQ8_9SPHN|nr:hypothetical protein [Sphingomonas panacisoli]QDZ08720.1 hypothetical protein FPZ24_15635 [Sphingomonas panacisoli]
MWVTFGVIVAVAVCIAIYLIIGSMRHGATFREVLPPAALLAFGIALAAGLLTLEGILFPAMTYNVAGVTYYMSLGLPSIVAIAVCMGIAKVWGRMFGSTAPEEKRAEPNEFQ